MQQCSEWHAYCSLIESQSGKMSLKILDKTDHYWQPLCCHEGSFRSPLSFLQDCYISLLTMQRLADVSNAITSTCPGWDGSTPTAASGPKIRARIRRHIFTFKDLLQTLQEQKFQWFNKNLTRGWCFQDKQYRPILEGDFEGETARSFLVNMNTILQKWKKCKFCPQNYGDFSHFLYFFNQFLCIKIKFKCQHKV